MEYISNYEVITSHLREKELDWYEQGDKKNMSHQKGQMKSLDHL